MGLTWVLWEWRTCRAAAMPAVDVMCVGWCVTV